MQWSDLPEAERARLIKNEAAQRRQTVKRGLPALPCSPEALWMLQRGMCTCNECRGEKPLIVGEIVIAHVYFRAGKGSPGHVPTNVALWNDACNRREAPLETSALGRGRRLAPEKTPKIERQRAKANGTYRKIPGKPFAKPTGPSRLSKKHPEYQKRKMR